MQASATERLSATGSVRRSALPATVWMSLSAKMQQSVMARRQVQSVEAQ
jgi:hypothetical protein